MMRPALELIQCREWTSGRLCLLASSEPVPILATILTKSAMSETPGVSSLSGGRTAFKCIAPLACESSYLPLDHRRVPLRPSPDQEDSMRQSFQRGYLRCTERKSGPACWEYLWREYLTNGKPIRRTVVIGTTLQYQTRDLAIAAINGLIMQVNAERYRRPGYSISVSDLIDHYIETELSAAAVWHSHATRVTNRYLLNN